MRWLCQPPYPQALFQAFSIQKFISILVTIFQLVCVEQFLSLDFSLMLAPERPVLRSQAFILIGGFLLAFLGALGTVLATWSSRDVALRDWESRVSAAARMLSAHAGQSISAADLILRAVAEHVNEYGVRDAEEMRHTFGTQPIFDMLRHATRGLPQIDVLTIVARDGTVLNLTREFPPPPINLADRDYFNAHMEDPDLDVFLSRPVQNRGNGTWTFYLTRKITSPSGETIGLVLAGLHTKFFADFYQSIGLEATNVALFRLDGAVLSQSGPDVPNPSNHDLSPAIKRIISKQNHAIVLTSGPRVANVQDFQNMTAFDANNFLPVGVAVTASRQQVLSEWENQAIKFVLEGGTMTCGLIFATILLARLISQLEKARNAALRAVEAKNRFVSNVSHELRTPMNAIIGGTHQLMQTGLKDESHRYAQIVSNAAQQLMVFINDILDFSYYEANQFHIEKAPIDTRDLVESTLEMARALEPHSSLDLMCRITDNVPERILGDSGRIKQILLNLLSNAVKFTEKGSVTLRVTFYKGSIPERDRLVFDVIDTGPGISRADQERIFQPFERGSLSQKHPGTGLGLTISKKLVEAMSGSISFSSRLGLGTRFSVTLPVKVLPTEPHDTQAMDIGSDVPKPLRHLTILIAEDVAPNRILLTIMLEKMGHTIVAVENGLLAVEAAQARAFDLILMDLQMPELNGIESTKRIRAQSGPSQRARIIAVSANADLDGPNGLASAGFDDTLMKPVTPTRLNFVIAAIAGEG